MKDQFSLFIVAVLLQQLTVHGNNYNNTVMLENATQCVCKYHLVYMSIYILISVSAAFFIMVPIRYQYTKTQPIYDFSDNTIPVSLPIQKSQ